MSFKNIYKYLSHISSMRRRIEVILALFILVLSMSFASAGMFDFLTGEVIDDSSNTWTSWLNRDGPSGSGDYETLDALQLANPGKICNIPTGVECRVRGTEKDSSETGQVVVCEIGKGFYCKNENNNFGPYSSDRYECGDYEVRFYCGEEGLDTSSQLGSCSDSDGGDNYYVKGVISMYGSPVQEDECVSSLGILNEFVCGQDGTPMAIPGGYQCPSGVCENGACVEGSKVGEVEEEAVCTDSDGGDNYYVKGVISMYGSPVQEDECVSSLGILNEFVCGQDGTPMAIPGGYQCPSGVCENGACVEGSKVGEVEEEAVCTDSDGGDNIYVGGIIKTNDRETKDACVGKRNLLEGICNEDGSYEHVNIDCPRGYECVENACVEEFCNDSDGDDIYVKGFITDEKGVREEHCLEERYAGDLMETYCSGVGTIASVRSCPGGYGCSDGACVEKSKVEEENQGDFGLELNCSDYAIFGASALDDVEVWFDFLNSEEKIPSCENYLVDRDGLYNGARHYTPEGDYTRFVFSGYFGFDVYDYSDFPFKFETPEQFVNNHSIFSKKKGTCAFDSSWRSVSRESDPVCYDMDPFDLIYSSDVSTLNESYCRAFLDSMKKGRNLYGSSSGGYIKNDKFNTEFYFPSGGKCIGIDSYNTTDICSDYYIATRASANWKSSLCEDLDEGWKIRSAGPTHLSVFDEKRNFVGQCFGISRTFVDELGTICNDPNYEMSGALLPENIQKNTHLYSSVLDVPKFSESDCQVIWHDLIESVHSGQRLVSIPSEFYAYESQGGLSAESSPSVYCFNSKQDLSFDLKTYVGDSVEEVEVEKVEVENKSEEEVFYEGGDCVGCELEGQCYALGRVKDGKYCSENLFVFADSKVEGDSCNQNFECLDNICLSGNCVSSNLWTRFLKWFSR
jgi:hypothetical protein